MSGPSPSSSPAAPIHARFSRLSTFSSEGFSVDSESVRAQLGKLDLDFSSSSQTNSPRAYRHDSGSASPWTASPSSFYQATFDSSPQLGRQASYGFSPSPSLGGADYLVDRQQTTTLSSPTPNRPTPVSRRSSVLGNLLKRKPSSNSTPSSSRASSPLGRSASSARGSPLASPISTPGTDSASAPRLSPFPFTRQGSDQLNPIDEMNLLGRGGSKAAKEEYFGQKKGGWKEASAGSASGAGPVAPPAQEEKPQLRIADRFASSPSSTQIQPQYPTKPLPSAAASSIPTAIRPVGVPVASPPRRAPAPTQPSTPASFEPTAPVGAHRPTAPANGAAPATTAVPNQPRASAMQRHPTAEGVTSSEDAYDRASSEDMQHSSSASGSLPQTPVDEQREWGPRKQNTFDSVSSSLPAGASPSAFQSPTSSPSRSTAYSLQTSSPFTPPLSPSQSFTTNGSVSGYNPMAAFFGSASPPPRSMSGHASPPPTSPSTPVAPSPVARPSASRVPQPPSTYSDEEEDPYKEFTKPKTRPSMAPSSVGSSRSPPVSPSSARSQTTLPPRSASAQYAQGRREGSDPASPTSLRQLRSQNSFYTAAKVAPTAVDEMPPVPTGAQSRVAAAVQAAEKHRLDKARQAAPPAVLKPAFAPTSVVKAAPSSSSEASASTTSPARLQKRRQLEAEQVPASRIPVSPAAKLHKTLPPAPAPVASLPSSPRQQAVPQMRAPSVGNLRAAALAQSASRHQAVEPRPQVQPVAAQLLTTAPTELAVQPEAAEGEAEAAVEEEPLLCPRFEYAMSIFPTTILAPILAQLEYDDFRALRVVSKTMLRSVEGPASEVVLQRFLGPCGYRSLNPVVTSRGTGSVVIHSSRQIQAEASARRRFGGSEGAYGASYAAKSAAAKADSNAAGGVALTLKDLHGFQTGLKIEVMEYAKMARGYAHNQLPAELARMARASTRAYNRVVLRLRAQSELARDSTQPAFLFRNVPKAATAVFKAGRAPMLRVWVPTAKGQSWMGDDEVVECEREVWRAGLWNLLRRGDLVHNVAVGDFANDGKLISDGKYLRDLEFKYDAVGHCPEWIDMLSLAPSYYHNLIASSTNNPVFYLALNAFAGRIRESLMLCTDKVQVSSPQGNYLVKRFVYRGATKVRAGTIIGNGGGVGGSGPGGIEVVHEGWAGQIVVETDGTTEHASMLLERCESATPVPWVVLRDKSRPDCIWLRPVTDEEAI